MVAGSMPDFDVHFEEFLNLAGLGHDKVLIAWGGFYFRRGDSPYGEWRIVDDEELSQVAPSPRTETIGAGSEPFGKATVEVERDGRVVARVDTEEHNHAWVMGLEPDTEYRYRVLVDGRPWGEGELLDWSVEEATLVPAGGRYDNRFRTFPPADARVPVTFAVLGDFGVGIVDGRLEGVRQLLIARALERAVDARDVRLVITTGDNIYLGHQDTAGTGNEDDDWYSSFYQPYRYVLNRVPFFPTVGNHDAGDSESSDDRNQLADNLFLDHRFASEVEVGSASIGPGLFYRFQVGANLEFICIDTSIATGMDIEHYFDDPAHDAWVRKTLLESQGARWRIPFSHHPPFCAGPEHTNTTGMVERLVPLFEEAGVRVVLSGHEHNFQYAVVNGIHYVVSGAAGKLRSEPPRRFEQAGTRAWAAAGHFLLGHADEHRVVLEPLANVRDDGSLEPIELVDPHGGRFEPRVEIVSGSRGAPRSPGSRAP
jgi:tartrate-resistant acid phosphatase type 5